MNIPPPIIPIPLPGAAAGAPQPNWANIGNSLNTLAAELPNVPNANPMAAILAMNANILQLVAGVNALQVNMNALQVNMNTLQGNMNSVQDELRLISIRTINGHASSDAPICYPAPFVGGGALPTTPAEARNLNGQASLAALNALAGAPGLTLPPLNAPVAARKAHLLGYLGIFP